MSAGMPDPMKHQDVFFVIEDEEWVGDGSVLTAKMLRRAARSFVKRTNVPINHFVPILHPDAWKALQEMDDETFLNTKEMTLAEAKLKWPSLGE